jgi:hypothetical protein
MQIDVVTQKLYVTSSRVGPGGKSLVCVAQIDLATWTIDKAWSTSTVPAFPGYFVEGGGINWECYHGEGVYVPISANGIVSVLNAQTDNITTYAFYDYATYGIAKNVTWTAVSGFWIAGNMTVQKVWVDAANNRLYVALTRTYVYNVCLQIGWIDLTAPGPDYMFTTVVSEVRTLSEEALQNFCSSRGWMEVVPADDLIIVSMGGGLLNAEGNLRIYSLSTGGLWKSYTTTSNPTFPKWGLSRGVYNNGVIAGVFEYEDLYGQADYRGLCLIDLASDVITYSRPSWASVDDYKLGYISLTDDGEYLIAALTYGVTLFDGVTWTLYDCDSVSGLTPLNEDYFYSPVLYNPTTDMIIAGAGQRNVTYWTGLIMFSRDGYIKQSNYRIGTYGTGWTWSAVAPLVSGFTDYSAAVCVDPDDDGLYAFWVNKLGTELSIKWDKEMPSFDLSPYIVRGTSVERFSSIDPDEGNWDAGLDFTVSSGHLFDVSNSKSMLRQYLSKGRRIQQQFGEKVAGVEYWEPARLFTVSDDGEMEYELEKYPAMSVSCETPRRRWEQIHIIASEYYTSTPEVIIADLLTTYAGILSANISLGTWANSATIEYQFVDVTLAAAVNQIAIHFGYAIRDGENGIIEAVKITDSATVARTYSDNTKLVNAQPQNKNSSFVNRWTVECEESTFIELLMAEELAAEINASHRWNTGSKTYRVNYTQGSKIFRNPRLDVVQSVESLGFKLAGGCSETLLDTSHNETDQTKWDTYCDISIDAPDLTPELIAAIALVPVNAMIGDAVVSWGGGWTRPVGSFITSLGLMLISMVLSSTGNFYYRIYGQPVVKARRTVSATANDTAHQVKMGQIIPEPTFQDPLCGNSLDCQAIADFRKMVGMGERARWSAEMVADLQNEDGDTLSVIHPFSGDAITVYLTDMKTSYLMPEKEEDEGYFNQQFEGWRR